MKHLIFICVGFMNFLVLLSFLVALIFWASLLVFLLFGPPELAQHFNNNHYYWIYGITAIVVFYLVGYFAENEKKEYEEKPWPN